MALSRQELISIYMAWQNDRLREMLEPGSNLEVMVFYGQRFYPDRQDLLRAGHVEEHCLGSLYGIKPGVVLLLDNGQAIIKTLVSLAGVLERDEDQPEQFDFRPFPNQDLVPFLRLGPQSPRLAERFPYYMFYKVAEGRESPGYHFVIPAARWQEMKAFFDKWLPVPAAPAEA